ncbi:benzoate membrane transport protein [Diaminobutyricimonas aerilata]|uniref:Benzoate membrane transport protein n=1 Tax=Diaminobutyricimonas aerilata TaxID=1162967 RepID=A0A2M9CJ67_9MICO|nr:benzoate/H(+) symporter BenE family transporter [Diaminobutyricimonas aerilata]PJJ71946.1 benzoate membrane transport protein [Diaminobutyricimonas aerilata]
MIQPLAAGVIGAVTGFASSFAIVIAGLQAVGATPAQAASGLLVLCIGQGVLAVLLSWRTRLPLSFAWSTPGAAVLVSAHAVTGDFRAAVGAFLVCGVLILATGLWPWLRRTVVRIPRPVGSAMLAGILFPICIAPVTASIEIPLLALPVVGVWLVLVRLAPRWAVPAAMVVAAVGIGMTAGGDWLVGDGVAPRVEFVVPVFDPLVIVSLGLPLYIVTMAGQNVPGFAVLTTLGYDDPPARAVLVGSGAVTAFGSVFGAHAVNLAALSAAIMAGPDAHPDRSRRWIAAVSGGVVYLALGLAAGLASALVAAAPPVLITAVAGLALLSALIAAVVAALEEAEHRIAAIATFLVVASGVTIAGIGSSFWGLVVGGVVMAWLGWGRRRLSR